MPKFCKTLDLPNIPAELIPDLENLKLKKTKSEAQAKSIDNWTMTQGSQVVSNLSSYVRFDAPAELVDWARQNISDEFHNIGISYWTGGATGLPHTDLSRDVALFYLFTTGGDAVETKFWRYNGQIHFEGHIHPESYEELELLESVVLNSNTWNILDAKVVHSVENLSGDRIALQLGFSQQTSMAKQYFNFKD
jgi:hypothetical protein